MMENNSEIAAALGAITSSMSMLQSSVDRVAEKADSLGKSVARVDTRSAAAREAMNKSIADGLQKNRECISESNEMNRKAHEALREEIRTMGEKSERTMQALISDIEKDVDEVEVHASKASEKADKVGDRVTSLETHRTKTKARDATAVGILSVFGTGLALILTGKFGEFWKLITGG